MEHRRLGTAGLKVSAVGLGGNTFGRYADEAQTARIVHAAIASGVNIIDTADIYNQGRSEEFVGSALAGRRGDMLIATKVGMAAGPGPNQIGASRQRIMDGVHAGLKRLQTDYIDLFQIHRADPTTPIEETMRALDDLVKQGKVRYIGASNYTAWELTESIWASRTHSLAEYATIQPAYNLLDRSIDRELVPMCEKYGVGIIPYSPLAGGFLTGKYRKDAPIQEGTRGYNNAMFGRTMSERNFAVLEKLEAFASAREHGVGELAMAWLLARPMVCSVIAGATRPEQVEENAASINWKLTAAEMAELDEITKR